MKTAALRILAPLAAAFAAVLALGTSAFAGTVSPGGPFTATVSPWTIRDPATGATITCGSLTLAGTLASSPGTTIGSVGSAAAGSCSGPGGISLGLTFLGLPWTVDETAYSGSTGVATGTITGVRVQLSGPLCSATTAGVGGPVTPGTLNWSHNNDTSPQLLAVSGGALRVYSVSGCLGLLDNGDSATFASGTFTLSPPQMIS